MDEWRFLYLLPHIDLSEPIENGVLAAVPCDDDRLSQIFKREKATHRLATSFTDQFGDALRTSCILSACASAVGTDYWAIKAFRNVIATCITGPSWTQAILGGNVPHVLWSDHFDLYPFTPTKDGRDLIGNSIALGIELNRPDKFQGQRAPHLRSNDHGFYSLDDRLSEALMRMWNKCFLRDKKSRYLEKLFRSLETAYMANRVPGVGSHHPSIHDIGVSLGLWVSAFEILSHPGSQRVSRNDVIALLGGIEWLCPEVRQRRYTLRNHDGKTLRDSQKKMLKFNLCQKLYGELYRARNDFLHGNRVRFTNLRARGAFGEFTLLHCAPVLYRVALAVYLNLKPRRVTGNNRQDILSEQIAFAFSDIERALMIFWKGEKDDDSNGLTPIHTE